MSFITEPTSSFVGAKVNWRERPEVRTEAQWLSADDINKIRNGMLDLRTSVISIAAQTIATTVTDQIIYVRPSGSDTAGDGTITKPYQTFAKAITDVPAKCDMIRYWIDVTGVTEYIPHDTIFAPRFGVPMNSMIDRSGWDQISFLGSASFLYNPPAEFPWVSHAENINVVSAPQSYFTIPSGTTVVSSLDAYSNIQQILFTNPGAGWSDGQYDNYFLTNVSHPRMFIPIWKSVAANILYVAASSGEVPLLYDGWQIVRPSANVMFVSASSSADRVESGMWLGGGSCGIQLFGVNWLKDPTCNLTAKWTLLNQSGPVIENFCRTETYSSSWGANVVSDGATFESFQSVINGLHLIGGGSVAASNCSCIDGDVRVISGTNSDIKTFSVVLGLRDMAFRGGQISTIGGCPGTYHFKNIRVEDQDTLYIGVDGEQNSSRGADVTFEGFYFYNAFGSADVTILNNKNCVLINGNVVGAVTLDQETQLLMRNVYVDGKFSMSDNCWVEMYGGGINGRGGNVSTAPEVSIGRGCYASILTTDFATNTSFYINDRAKVYMRRVSATFDASNSPWSGSQFVVNRRAELAISSPNFVTSSLPSNNAFFWCGGVTGSYADLRFSGSLESTLPGYGKPLITWY